MLHHWLRSMVEGARYRTRKRSGPLGAEPTRPTLARRCWWLGKCLSRGAVCCHFSPSPASRLTTRSLSRRARSVPDCALCRSMAYFWLLCCTARGSNVDGNQTVPPARWGQSKADVNAQQALIRCCWCSLHALSLLSPPSSQSEELKCS